MKIFTNLNCGVERISAATSYLYCTICEYRNASAYCIIQMFRKFFYLSSSSSPSFIASFVDDHYLISFQHIFNIPGGSMFSLGLLSVTSQPTTILRGFQRIISAINLMFQQMTRCLNTAQSAWPPVLHVLMQYRL